jgi:hypothetical protein
LFCRFENVPPYYVTEALARRLLFSSVAVGPESVVAQAGTGTKNSCFKSQNDKRCAMEDLKNKSREIFSSQA